jgi:enamine deaminase RidA (YjgF/YER057c/UK114 family)
MSDKKVPVSTNNAPKPLPGIYSQAIKAGGFVFVSGATPTVRSLRPKEKRLSSGSVD